MALKEKMFISQAHQWWLWIRREKSFWRFIRKISKESYKIRKSEEEREIWVIIQSWIGTPLPWFMMTLALMLIRRGRKVRLIWDDYCFAGQSLFERYVRRSIGRVLNKWPGQIETVHLSNTPPAEKNVISEEDINRLVELNTIQHFRAEKIESESETFQKAIKQKMRWTEARMSFLLNHNRLEYMILGGGIFNSSGIFLKLAMNMGIRAASIDSGPGIILASTNGIAANMDDVDKAFKMLPADEYWVETEARDEMTRRMNGRDLFASQMTAMTGQAENIGVLIPLNQSFDTSALGRHFVFKNQLEWMVETVDWLLAHSQETIVVRRHPVERNIDLCSKDDYQAVLIAKFARNPRLIYIPENSSINTYDLINQAKIVVPYVSTVGIEAAVMGKPVVTEGSSCYADLGFVWKAETRKSYFELLSRALAGELILNNEQRRMALRCYYLTQCCNYLLTEFTPQPMDYDLWIKSNIDELLYSDEVSDLLDVLDQSIPLSIIRHRRRKLERPINVK